MTLRQPLFLFNASGAQRPTAKELRLWLGFLTGPTKNAGVIGTGALKVSQHTTPNMSVDVAIGPALLAANEGASEGLFFVYNDAVNNPTIAAADPTNPRKDLIIANVRNQEESGANNDWQLSVVQGTAAASPVDPSPTAAGFKNFLTLARVNVAALASTIVNANIDDLRVGTGFGSGAIASAAGLFPAAPGTGFEIYQASNDRNEGEWLFNSGGVYRPPWNMPWGIPADPVSTGTASTVTSGATETRDAVMGNYVFTSVANRRYAAWLLGASANTDTNNDLVRANIRNGGASTPTSASTQVATDQVKLAVSGGAGQSGIKPIGTFVPGAGTQTLSVFTVRVSGAGIESLVNTRELFVTDIGPAGAPA